jgi:phosphoenolpyruvate carboxykinase (GTP)
MTAAAAGKIGEVRRDPFAMLPFCGYHVGDYFRHWLDMGRRVKDPPKIFTVNWFRKDEQGRFLWPGFGENMRVLQWIVERCAGRAHSVETPLGLMPAYEDLVWSGLDFGPQRYACVQAIQAGEWSGELSEHAVLFGRLGERLPRALAAEQKGLTARMGQV